MGCTVTMWLLSDTGAGQSVGWGLKNSLEWPLFFKYFWQFKEKWRPTFVIFAQRPYNNQAHEPGQHMWPNLASRPNSECSKTVEVGCLELKPCQRKIATDEIQERKKYRELSNINVSMHWLAQCQAKWQQGCRRFQHPVEIEPKQPYSLFITLTTKPSFCVSRHKKLYNLKCSATCKAATAFLHAGLSFSYCSGWIKARHEIPEALIAHLWLIHSNTFDIDLIWNIFTLQNFCSLLIEQLINLEKWELRTWNLGQPGRSFISSYGWLALTTADDCLQRQIAQKNSNLLVLSTLVTYMAFKHSISFATNLAANFGCHGFRIIPDIISKLFCSTMWSQCVASVWFESEQTPFPRTGHWLRSAACTEFDLEHAVLFLCHMFTQQPMNDRKIMQSDGCGFGLQQLLA